MNNSLIYTIKYVDNSNRNYDQIQEDDQTTINQTTLIASAYINVCNEYSLVKNDAKITHFIPQQMPHSKQGYLLQKEVMNGILNREEVKKLHTNILSYLILTIIKKI